MNLILNTYGSCQQLSSKNKKAGMEEGSVGQEAG